MSVYPTPRLASVREAGMWTQKALATAARTTEQTISRLENGGNASAETVRKLARALDVLPSAITLHMDDGVGPTAVAE